MKYKNYRNPLTGDNRIYSVDEISKMPLSEVLNKKTEILSQFKKIGVPKSLELQNSENVVFVHEYTRDDGTIVKSHWRSKPGGSCSESSTKNQLINEAGVLSQNVENNSVQKNKDIKFIKPVEGRITSEYGYRKAPVKGASTFHSGIDIEAPIGTAIVAISDGTVTAARSGMDGYGIGVFINHGKINEKEVKSEYGHLSKYIVKVGEKVKKGQVIGYSGSSGISNGPHLHLTIREFTDGKWQPVNPNRYVKY